MNKTEPPEYWCDYELGCKTDITCNEYCIKNKFTNGGFCEHYPEIHYPPGAKRDHCCCNINPPSSISYDNNVLITN